MIYLSATCSGCDLSISGKLHREFKPLFHGGDSGLGRWELRIELPDGWVPFDPYTNVTYCPICWADIEAPDNLEATA